jgi:parvulin-like peptidyl-prolyl isomerase
MTNRRVSIGTGLVAASALVAFVAAATALVWSSETTAAGATRAVAFVNGTAISSDDLDLRLSQILPLASFHGNLPPGQLLSLKRAALDELVLDELIYREAAAAGRRPSPAAVDTEVSSARARFDSREAFAAALRENGLNEAAFRERLGRSVVVREARDARAHPEIAEADLAVYYRDNGPKFQRPEQVRLRQILFRVDPADPATAGPAEAKARTALKQLSQGEPFGPLARRVSEDEYRVKDGDMGLVHRGRLDPEFEDAVFAAPVGQLQLARCLHGFEVFEVLERQPRAQLTFEQARPIIAERLARQRRVEGLRAWKAGLLAGARVQIRDAELSQASPAELAEEGEARAGGWRRRGLTGDAR